jgi:copper chaperone
MTTFSVPDMSCGHCVSTITKAIRGLDPAADIKADLAARTVTVESAAAASSIVRALEDAGYPATVR